MVKNPPANAGNIMRHGFPPGSERCLGGGHGNPPQYSSLQNSMNREAWWAAVRSQRVGYDWSDLTHIPIYLLFTFTFTCLYIVYCSVAQSCPTLCDPMDCSMPGVPVHQQLLELAKIRIHWVGYTHTHTHTYIYIYTLSIESYEFLVSRVLAPVILI